MKVRVSNYKSKEFFNSINHFIMKFLVVLICLALSTQATFIAISGISAGAVAVILGAKILALKGFLIGSLLSRRRGRREIPQDLQPMIYEASLEDQFDCTKRLICELHAKSSNQRKVNNFKFYAYNFEINFWSI